MGVKVTVNLSLTMVNTKYVIFQWEKNIIKYEPKNLKIKKTHPLFLLVVEMVGVFVCLMFILVKHMC